jgi:hypothetical protein
MKEFINIFGYEMNFTYNIIEYPFVDIFLHASGCNKDINLSQIHNIDNKKEHIYYNIVNNYNILQNIYNDFILNICIPYVYHKLSNNNTTTNYDDFYYQIFPCIRIIQPNEFSIGPHSDCMYGHHPCSINFYIPLTSIYDTCSLYLEHSIGSEDWHPIISEYGHIYCFPGALSTHWTTENKTNHTRISLDFRIIPGNMYHNMKCSGDIEKGQLDVYRQKDGYYSYCRKKYDQENNCIQWERIGPLMKPDSRIGYPWTVKNWNNGK